jgi:hypothetical protein
LTRIFSIAWILTVEASTEKIWASGSEHSPPCLLLLFCSKTKPGYGDWYIMVQQCPSQGRPQAHYKTPFSEQNDNFNIKNGEFKETCTTPILMPES